MRCDDCGRRYFVRDRIARSDPIPSRVSRRRRLGRLGHNSDRAFGLVLLAQGNSVDSVASLKHAVALAEPEEFVRLFLDEDAQLLKHNAVLITHSITQSLNGKITTRFSLNIGTRMRSRLVS